MAIVKSEQFEAFLREPKRRAAMFLLYGTDSDLASERARRLVPTLVSDAADPFQVVRLTADTLAKDPGRLADEASAISMFGGARVIWIEAGGRDLSGAPRARSPIRCRPRPISSSRPTASKRARRCARFSRPGRTPSPSNVIPPRPPASAR